MTGPLLFRQPRTAGSTLAPGAAGEAKLARAAPDAEGQGIVALPDDQVARRDVEGTTQGGEGAEVHTVAAARGGGAARRTSHAGLPESKSAFDNYLATYSA